jgi:hypothetical protein
MVRWSVFLLVCVTLVDHCSRVSSRVFIEWILAQFTVYCRDRYGLQSILRVLQVLSQVLQREVWLTIHSVCYPHPPVDCNGMASA